MVPYGVLTFGSSDKNNIRWINNSWINNSTGNDVRPFTFKQQSRETLPTNSHTKMYLISSEWMLFCTRERHPMYRSYFLFVLETARGRSPYQNPTIEWIFDWETYRNDQHPHFITDTVAVYYFNIWQQHGALFWDADMMMGMIRITLFSLMVSSIFGTQCGASQLTDYLTWPCIIATQQTSNHAACKSNHVVQAGFPTIYPWYKTFVVVGMYLAMIG